MTDKQLTANDVAVQLAGLSRQLAVLIESMEGAERDAVNRREDYTLAHSRAFLKAEGPMDVRKHAAIVETHAERLAAETADMLVRGLRRQIDGVRVRIDPDWKLLISDESALIDWMAQHYPDHTEQAQQITGAPDDVLAVVAAALRRRPNGGEPG